MALMGSDVSRKVRQVGSLYMVMVGSMALGFLISIINTRTLGPASFGDLKFITNLFQFISTIATLGLFTTGAQLMANLEDGDVRRNSLIGALLMFAGMISLLGLAATAIFSFFEPGIFGNNLGGLILLFSPMIAVAIFQPCIENILQGDNRIEALSIFRLAPVALFALLLLIMSLAGLLNLEMTLLLQFVVGVTMTIVLLRWLKPSFSSFPHYRKMIWEANKTYGWHVYIGILSGVATAYLSTFLISYFLDNTNVGFYSLAVTLTMPLLQIPSVVGTTYFKDFAHRDALPRKVTVVTSGMSAVTLALFLILIRPLVLLVYTDKFLPVASLAMIMATGSVLHGMGDYFNRFLGAHGRGKELRNGAIAVGTVNVLGYLILVQVLGINGAAITRLLAGGTYCGMMVIYYRGFRKGRTSAALVQTESRIATSESLSD